ncbi:hypothetical protein KSP40_PGU016609 [Platanthera guangdongensis]|uniref:Uncharacterized protein n=1 Tax=Platanthera guangdongensis TaxID=2320717 RepID=A0ABR2N5U7_9ASPA
MGWSDRCTVGSGLEEERAGRRWRADNCDNCPSLEAGSPSSWLATKPSSSSSSKCWQALHLLFLVDLASRKQGRLGFARFFPRIFEPGFGFLLFRDCAACFLSCSASSFFVPGGLFWLLRRQFNIFKCDDINTMKHGYFPEGSVPVPDTYPVSCESSVRMSFSFCFSERFSCEELLSCSVLIEQLQFIVEGDAIDHLVTVTQKRTLLGGARNF